MWNFSEITFGELREEATKAVEEGLASQFLNAYRAVEAHADGNIVYALGYYNDDKASRLQAAFGLLNLA
jgi:hypothetical protein